MPKGKINVEVDAKTGKAVKNMKKLAKGFKATGVSMMNVAKGAGVAYLAVKGLDAIFGVIKKSIGGFIGLLKDSSVELAKHGDRMAKQARMVGVSAEQYQMYEFAATRAGTSVKHVSNGLKKLGRVMVDAQNGSRQIKETFAALGIELKKEDGTLRDVNDVFMELADKSMAMGESAERTGTLMLLLGRSGTEMANLMENGSAGIEEMGDRLKDLGGVMSGEALADSEAFIDAQADLEAAFRGVKIAIGTELIPELTALAEQMVDWIVGTDWSEVASFTRTLLDGAAGAGRLTAELLNLSTVSQSIFGERAFEYASIKDPEVRKLTARKNAARDLADGLASLKPTTDQMAFAALGLSTETDKVDGAFFRLQSTYQKGAHTSSIAAVALARNRANAGELTRSLVGLAEYWSKTELSAEEFTDAVLVGTQATEEQLKAAIALGRARREELRLDAELAGKFKQKIADDEAAVKAKEDAIAQSEKDGEVIKQRIANLETERKKEAALRKAKAKGAAAARRQAADARKDAADELKALKALQAQRLAMLMYGLDLETQIYETFNKTALTELERVKSAELDLISAWEKRGTDRHEEAMEYRKEVDRRYREGKRQIREEELAEEREAAAAKAALLDEEATKARETMLSQMNDAAAVMDAVGRLSSTLGGFAKKAYEEGDESARAAAVAMFLISQAAALGSATVNTAAAVTAALANPPGPPGSIPQAVAAGVAGAAQIATIVGTSVKGIGDAGLTSDTLRKAGMSNHSAIIMRNDETVLDPVGTKHITEMLAMQKAQMQNGGGDQTIRTTVELDGRVLGESVDTYLIRQQERGLQYSDRIRQEYV